MVTKPKYQLSEVELICIKMKNIVNLSIKIEVSLNSGFA